jgi:hypothetical protein
MNNLVHIVWYDHRTGYYEIFYKRSTDGGINWGNDIKLSIGALGASVHPA